MLLPGRPDEDDARLTGACGLAAPARRRPRSRRLQLPRRRRRQRQGESEQPRQAVSAGTTRLDEASRPATRSPCRRCLALRRSGTRHACGSAGDASRVRRGASHTVRQPRSCRRCPERMRPDRRAHLAASSSSIARREASTAALRAVERRSAELASPPFRVTFRAARRGDRQLAIGQCRRLPDKNRHSRSCRRPTGRRVSDEGPDG